MDHCTRMFTVRKNCAQMLADRDYMVGEVRTLRVSVPHAHMRVGTRRHARARTPTPPAACAAAWQDDLECDLASFRSRFGDVPQKNDLTLLCPSKKDPTDRVRQGGTLSAKQCCKSMCSLQWCFAGCAPRACFFG
jgi:RNA polymerase Rpb5, N-terminal domain